MWNIFFRKIKVTGLTFCSHPCMCCFKRGMTLRADGSITASDSTYGHMCFTEEDQLFRVTESQVWATNIRLSRPGDNCVRTESITRPCDLYMIRLSWQRPRSRQDRGARATGKRWLRPRINNQSFRLWREKI